MRARTATAALLLSFGALVLAPAAGRAQAPPDPQRIMVEMQQLQQKYAAIEAEREAERASAREDLCAEELEKAQARAASVSGPYDPYAAADHACNQRLEALRAKWREEDAALEAAKREDLAGIMGGFGMPVPPQP